MNQDDAYITEIKRQSEVFKRSMAIGGVFFDCQGLRGVGEPRPNFNAGYKKEIYQRIADLMISDGDPSFYPHALQAALALRDGAESIEILHSTSLSD